MKYGISSFEIDTVQFEIKNNSTPISVEPKVFDLIVYLIENRERLISRDELFEQIWQGREVTDTTLSNSIKSARKIFGDSGEVQLIIRTVRGRGYQFVAEVFELERDNQPNLKRKNDKRRLLNYPLLGSVFLILTGWFFYPDSNIEQENIERPYILVTPFEITGKDVEKWQPFADQMTRDVIRNLRKVSGLNIVPQSSAFTFKENKSYQYIKEQLPDVDFVLSSTVNLWGDSRIQVVSELEELDTQKLVWDTQLESRIDDTAFFSIKSEIAMSLSASLEVAILDNEKATLGELPTDNLRAYELYVMGQQRKNELTRISLLQAVDLYSQAIALDPKFEAAYVAKADTYRIIMAYFAVPEKILPKVTEAVAETLNINPQSAEAHSALGLSYVLAWRWQDAWKVLNQAKELRSDLALTELGFALYYSGIGDIEGLYRSLERANQLDPLNVELADWGHWSLAMAGEVDAAIKWGKEKTQLHPDVGMIFSGASVSASLAGDHQRAVALAKEGLRLEVDSPYPLLALAQAYGYAGQVEKIPSMLEQAEKFETYLCSYEVAVIHLILSDIDKAFEYLNKAISDRSNCLVFTRNDPRLELVRGDNRYNTLLMRVGLDDKSIAQYAR